MLSGTALLVAFAAAAAASALGAPLAARVALRAGFVDAPGGRKRHGREIPLLGGAAALAGALAGAAAAGGRAHPAVLAAGLLVFAIGLADDRRERGVSPRARLLVEGVAAAVAVALGPCRVGVLPVDALDAALTAAFLVLAANALNLSDNVNGLAAGIAAAASGALAVAAAARGDAERAAALAALAGGAAGFLPWNWPRARLFLGDAGALALGFLIPAIALSGPREAAPAGDARFLAVVVALGVPLADTAFVVVSRLRRGASPFAGDRRHVSHRLAALGLGEARAAAALVAASLVVGALAAFAAIAGGGAALASAGGAALVLGAVLALAARSKRGLDDDG